MKRNRDGEPANVGSPTQDHQMSDIFGDSDEEQAKGNDDEQPKQRRKVDLFGDSDED